MLAYGGAACELPIRATMPARKIVSFFSFCGVFSVGGFLFLRKSAHSISAWLPCL